jgi:signal transduction histidine kinase
MMRLVPRSIRGRLLVAGLIFTSIALVVATFAIGEVLDRLVRRNLDERLDSQIALLLRSVRPDGTVDVEMLREVGPFTQYRRGWTWRIEVGGRRYESDEVVPLDNIHAEGRPGREGRFRGGDEVLQSGQNDAVYVRTLEKRTPAGMIRIVSAAPHLVFVRMREGAMVPALATLAALGAALLLASLVQLHIGLRPLKRLKTALADVRSGSIGRVPGDQPVELAPVVAELNGLLDENEAALARARGHVANLAHSLKTPLATLSIRLNETGRDPDGQLNDLVAQIDGAIRHHLSRARAASPGAPGQPQVAVTTLVDELVQALNGIYAERGLSMTSEIAPGLMVKCDPRDLTEMLGNLLDNACKWAAGRIVISGMEDGKMAHILIEDDGPGLSAEATGEALVPGRRLDERGDGHGFGLPITRELAELHGGALVLGAAAIGGLRVTLTLPR